MKKERKKERRKERKNEKVAKNFDLAKKQSKTVEREGDGVTNNRLYA